MKTLPAVIASRDGSRAILVHGLDCVARVANRDAVGHRFQVSNTPEGERFNIAVVFSGTTYAIRTDAFDLPEINNRDERFTQFALAAIGDRLDEGLIEDADGSYVTQIECFSPPLSILEGPASSKRDRSTPILPRSRLLGLGVRCKGRCLRDA